MSSLPPLPPGFTLDKPPAADLPPLPPGFKLDSSAASMREGAPAEPTQESPGLGDELTHATGRAGRDVVQGVANLDSLNPLVPISNLIFRIDEMLAGRPAGSNPRVTGAGPAARQLMDQAGVPAPRNATERVVSDIGQTLAGGGGTIGLARKAVGAGVTMAQRVMQKLAAAPGGQAISMATSATAGGVSREMGAGPFAQLMYTLFGAAAPSTIGRTAQAGAKTMIRGGEEGRQQVQDTLEDFAAAGTTPSVGQATGRRSMQAVESTLSKLPGGAGPIVGRADEQAAQISATLDQRAATLAPKATGEQAGRAIERGIRGEDGFVQQFRAKQGELYGELDKHIEPEQAVSVEKTLKAFAELTTPTKGAEATSAKLINQKISSLSEAFARDATGGTVPYSALRELRTRIGQELDSEALVDSVPKAQWKRLWGAMSHDLGAAARTAGDKAQQAWSRANHYTRAGMDRIEAIESVLNKNGGPEAVFRAATSGTREGATTLRAVMQSLPEDGQRMVTATVMRRLGRAKAGVQDDTGEKFSTETFLTNWNSLSQEAKRVLFDRHGEEFRQSMDRIASVAANLRDGSRVFANPSGTSQGAASITALTTFVAAIMSGEIGVSSGVAAGVGGANALGRLMVNPRFVRWLAKTHDKPQSAVPSLLQSLTQSKDLEIREGAALLQQAVTSQGSQQ